MSEHTLGPLRVRRWDDKPNSPDSNLIETDGPDANGYVAAIAQLCHAQAGLVNLRLDFDKLLKDRDRWRVDAVDAQQDRAELLVALEMARKHVTGTDLVVVEAAIAKARGE